MAKRNETKMVEIYAGQLWQATMVKNILEDNGIQVYLDNELMGTIDPGRIAAGGMDPVKVVVLDADYKSAMVLMDEFHNSSPSEEDFT